LAKGRPKGKKRKKKKGKREPSLWARWKKWRTTTESHKLTAKIIETSCILLMLFFGLVAALEHAYPPRTLVNADWSSGEWSGEVDTEWPAITIEPRASISNFYYEVVEKDSGKTIDNGVIKKTWTIEDEVRLPNDATYVITIDASGGSTPIGHTAKIVEHRLPPTTVSRLYFLNIFIVAFVAGYTVLYLFYWHRRFSKVYNRTFWIALSYYLFSIAMFRVLVSY
jgi:hypothetical protein